MLRYLVLLGLLLCGSTLFAQDTLPPDLPDTASVTPVIRPRVQVPRRPAIKKIDSTLLLDSFQVVRPLSAKIPSLAVLSDTSIYAHHGYYSFQNPVRYGVSIRRWEGKEGIFYTIIGLLLLFAIIRNGFYRYVDDLFKIFFRTSVKQRQIKEQLMESPLPSMMLNLFYLLSGGMFMALLLEHFGMGMQYGFWALFGYASLGLFLVYAIKYVSLKVLGWIFQVKEAVDSYIFIVFSTNKIIGMLLLPFVVVIAFTTGTMIQVVVIASLAVVGGLLAYRFFLSYATIHRQVHVSFFHFFLYLCAFELAPLLLINKLLFRLLGETY